MAIGAPKFQIEAPDDAACAAATGVTVRVAAVQATSEHLGIHFFELKPANRLLNPAIRPSVCVLRTWPV